MEAITWLIGSVITDGDVEIVAFHLSIWRYHSYTCAKAGQNFIEGMTG